MSGFLEGKTFGFMQELWSLLLEAQQEAKVCDGKVVSAGVPPSLVEEMQKQLEEKQRTKESVEEQLKHRAENSPLHDIEPNKLPTVIETRESNKPSNWDSDSVGLNVRQQTESARADRTRRCSERRHSRRSSRRKSSHSRDRHRHRRHERSPRKRHHRRHLSSHRHRSHKNKVRKDSHSDSDNASTHSEENSSGRKELKKDLNKGDLETRTEKVDSGNKEEPSAVLKENSVENDNSRDSLLAELARVERETELRRKALESMHKRTK